MSTTETPSGGADGTAWLTTYADAMTLLLSFFILLLSMSSFDAMKIDQLKTAVEQKFFGETVEESEHAQPLNLLREDLRSTFEEMDIVSGASITRVEQGLEIELSDAFVFPRGSAVIKRSFRPVLSDMAHAFHEAESYGDLSFEVQGHTDDVPINRPGYRSNWDLSSKRATNVIRYLINEGVEDTRLRAVAYAHTDPKVPNRDQSGRSIAVNQALNRRVVILVRDRTL